MNLEFLKSLQWTDYIFLGGCFVLVFVCGLMVSRSFFFDLGKLSAYREIQDRRRLRNWEDVP